MDNITLPDDFSNKPYDKYKKEETLRNALLERGFILKESSNEITGFNANYFVNFVKSQIDIILGKDEFFYVYKENLWKRIHDNALLKYLRNLLQEPRFGTWRSKLEKEYLAALKRDVYYPGDMNPFKNIINMKNGVFDINEFRFLPHDSKYMSTIQIPVIYNPSAKCPYFLKFLNEVFEGDTERISVSQEWFGYFLTTETKAQKALVLNGSGGNGKGVFTDILSSLIGEDNISHIPLNELNKGFSRVCLYDKTANISSENETDGKSLNTQYFKAIIGEDVINAEQKGKPVFSFKPTVKMCLSMNNLPTTNDQSMGYYRRLMILSFNVFFNENQRDKALKEKLKAELPGIFQWAVEGLRRLQSQNYQFSKCENMDALLVQYRESQNPMIEFFNDFIIREDDPSFRQDNKAVFNFFKTWASESGNKNYTAISTQKFWLLFESTAKEKGYSCKAGRSNKFRYHTGIKLMTPSNSYYNTNKKRNHSSECIDLLEYV